MYGNWPSCLCLPGRVSKQGRSWRGDCGPQDVEGYVDPIELWLETKGGLSDFRFNPLLPEVEEFMQSLLHSDPYVQRHGAIGHL
ncbi:hypothetical protein HID58_024700 [Brassica napus]|uniref:Uncharacterized protein n=1 Tax=Brassica napus TaxID=3708 RepID=A0ABQ8CJ19_BRANA|nr:hypothetical protein HID58_024700 [Brassica napus]